MASGRFPPWGSGYFLTVGQQSGSHNLSHGPTRLLLVDDELDLLSALSEILTEQGYAVVSTWEGESAVEIASVFDPNVLVTDFRLPGIDGVTTIRRIREDCPRVRAILVSGHISSQTRHRAEIEHVAEMFHKPVSIPDLLRALSDEEEEEQE
ncbi:MAG: response regulator receiver protein [Armatimonadetes bacterium]|jgi:CheY-like chemotaxis protein|nr:response regulator receiver protein [Armatimonadota bacterium]